MTTLRTGRSRLRRLLRWFLLTSFILTLSVMVAAIFVGGRLLAPAHQDIGPSPDDLPCETVAIASQSGSTLAGWFADPQQGRGTVVLLHPIRGNRLSMLDRARFLHQAGYAVLLIDLQAHGQSPGRHITAGYLERLDAQAAVTYAHQRRPHEPVAVIGWSLGGAAALLASPLDIDALVLEAVYPTIEQAVNNRVRMRLGPFSPIAAQLLLVQFRPRLGIDCDELHPIDHVADVGCPLLIMAGSADRHTPLSEMQSLFTAATEPKHLVIFQGATHENLLARDGPCYQTAVLDFLEQSMN
ncbi:MAG: alpha/beta fold hydrolase [Phycisphaeraceae bacterium]|nr:alpha/beta fold hydrolase [Phycisphaeraceae bacterium]